jgi:hypothetical protein
MWYWGYVEHLTPRVQKYKDAAEFGTGFHLALENYYRPGTVRGPHPAETWEKWADDTLRTIKTSETVDDEVVAKWVNFHQLGIDLAEAYVERYQGDPHWDVLDAERKFSVLIPDVRYQPLISEKGRRGYKPIVNFVGVVDLCYRDLNDGLVKMTDHKTAQQIRTDHLTLDTQASSYIAVASKALKDQQLIGPKESVAGMEYNFIRRTNLWSAPLKADYVGALSRAGIQGPKPLEKMLKADLEHLAYMNDIRVNGEEVDRNTIFKRHFVPRTPKERQRSIIRISEEARVMADVREGRLPILKHTQRDCYFCAFFDLCDLDESGADTDYFKESVYMKHDPYGDHDEKKASENGGEA